MRGVKAEIVKVEKQISTVDAEVQSYKELADIFKTRIPALIIHDTLSTIMSHANELLDSFNLGISVSIDTQATKTDGDLRETLDIKILSNQIERSYESYSGGQQDIINFCLRYSLSMVLKSLQSTSIRSVFLDEIWSALDPENRDSMMNALSIVRSSFDQVFAITHIPDMRDSFPAVIEVIESNGKSEVLHD